MEEPVVEGTVEQIERDLNVHAFGNAVRVLIRMCA